MDAGYIDRVLYGVETIHGMSTDITLHYMEDSTVTGFDKDTVSTA